MRSLMKIKTICAALGCTILITAVHANAFVVVDYFAGGSYKLTADGGKIYSSSSSSATHTIYDATAGNVGNNLGTFTATSGARNSGAHGGKMVTKNGSFLELWDLNSGAKLYSVTAQNSQEHGQAYDADNNRAYFGNGSGDVWWYDFDDNTSGYLGDLGQIATIANGENENYFEDLEIAGGFLWAVDGNDSDIHKFALDGTYLGKETTNAGLHIEGFGFDEVSNAFWVHSSYTPDFACSTCNGQILGRGHYIQKLGGFTDITPPNTSPVPEPGTIALLSVALLGMGVIRRRKEV